MFLFLTSYNTSNLDHFISYSYQNTIFYNNLCHKYTNLLTKTLDSTSGSLVN